LGAETGDAECCRENRTIKISTGGTSKGAYPFTGIRPGFIAAKSSLIPGEPSTARAISKPPTTGPRSIAGKIKMPANLGISAPCSKLGATIRSAPIHEIANVKRK
jgi:hypothetical protein